LHVESIIQALPAPIEDDGHDTIRWRETSTHQFTVKSAYNLLVQDQSIVDGDEVDKIVTRKVGLNCDPLKIILKLKNDSQVVYLEWLS